jgi:hypothetical protein
MKEQENLILMLVFCEAILGGGGGGEEESKLGNVCTMCYYL